MSRSTYQRHAQFRELDFTNTYIAQDSLGHALNSPRTPARDTSSNHDAGLDLGRDGTMAEPCEVCVVTLVFHHSLTCMSD